MASANSLAVFGAYDNEPPTSNYATHDTRNSHPVLDFDDTTAEGAVFSGVMPAHYSDATGITVKVHVMLTSAITGTVGFTVELERVDTSLDQDADSFAAAQTITAVTVPGTSGQKLILSVAITKGANMDSIVAGDEFRLRLKRDVANDNAAGDAEVSKIEVVET